MAVASPPRSRPRTPRALKPLKRKIQLWLIAGLLALMLGVAVIAALGGDIGGCGTSAAPSSTAQTTIPAKLMPLYMSAEEKYGVPWSLLASINSTESAFGQNMGPSSAGALGPMQFMPATWAQYGVDGNNDGRKNIMDPEDAIPAAAGYLKASGAPQDLQKAVFAYNHAQWYVDKVLALASKFAAGGNLTGPDNAAASAACDDLGGLTGTGNGKFQIAPGANAPGRELSAPFTAFVKRMASFYPGRLVLTTGTNHSLLTANGNVSDHSTGNAGDFGMVLNRGTNSGPVGTRIAAAAFAAAGLPAGEAVKRARAGGIQNIYTSNYRIQIIWLAKGHYDHVHVGVASSRPPGV